MVIVANPEWFLIIIVSIFLFVVVALSAVVIILNNKYRREMKEMALYQINTSAKIDSSIPEILDLIINESFNDYKIKALLPLEEGYINSKREEEIRKMLVFTVSNRISSAALDKLSLFYNIKNIADIIADKIYIIVMGYVLDHNSKLDDPDSSKN